MGRRRVLFILVQQTFPEPFLCARPRVQWDIRVFYNIHLCVTQGVQDSSGVSSLLSVCGAQRMNSGHHQVTRHSYKWTHHHRIILIAQYMTKESMKVKQTNKKSDITN